MKLFCLAVLCSLWLSAQPSSGVTVTVSRTVPVPVTEARFEISASTPAEVPFGEVLLALRSAGVTASDIYSISVDRLPATGNIVVLPFPGTRQPNGILWTFRHTTRSADLAATLIRLAAAASEARTASAGRVNMTFTLLSQGPSRADLETARRNTLPQLFSDAKARALLVTAAAGSKLEGLGALTDGFGNNGYYYISDPLLFRSLSERQAPSQFQQTFTLTAQFADHLPAGTEGVFVSAAQPDPVPTQINLSLEVRGPLTMTLSQAIAALQPLNIAATDLVTSGLVSSRSDLPSQTFWTFAKLVPISQLSLTITALNALRASLNSREQSLTVDADFSGITILPAEREAARSGVTTELVAQGKRLAQELARAAGYDAGDVLNIAENSYIGISAFSVLSYGDARYPQSLSLRFALKK